MKTTEHDILKTAPALKEMPFSTPEGYFESLKDGLKKPRTRTVSLWTRLSPYAAVAAVFIFLVSAGTFILERTVPDPGMTQEDYYVFSDHLMISTIYEMTDETPLAEAGIEDEDIIEYLIYSGISAEEIERSK